VRTLKTYLSLFILLLTVSGFSQQHGYWDKDRATVKEIRVAAGGYVVVNTEEFPVGTTEIVYRITLLDENQQMAGSLVSLLKSIPDPTGISQGSAGGVFLLSKISGDDKCKYAVFTDEMQAKKYSSGGKTEGACIIQSNAVNKDARRLSAGKSSCLTSDLKPLWFGFESTNWIFKQRIVLEVVPWVDNNLNRGWNDANKTAIINLAKTSDLVKKMLNPDDFCLCILSKIQRKHRYDEYSKLLAIEKSKLFRDFGNECLANKPENKVIINGLRADAARHIAQGRYEDAIALLTSGIMENGSGTAMDHNLLGRAYMYSRQYSRAIKTLKDGEQLDSAELQIQLSLAHAYMLNDEFSKAKEIHKKYKNQNLSASRSWKEQALADIKDLEAAGIRNKDLKRMSELLD
jgi:tetratricopeptide (TPR) repeat protein